MSEQGMSREGGPAGSIYDLGYQRYEGRRLGRRGAFLALYADSLRACFGLGRPGRAKVVPVGLTVLALLPALIAVAVEALARGAIPSPIRYDNYFSTIVQFLVLFVAAQAPELLGRDQRYRILPLFFSRALERLDYPAAKLLALTTALLVVSVLPQAGIFLGKVLGAEDLVDAFGDNLEAVPPILLGSLGAAIVMSSLGLAVAAFTSRRAYATAGIFALFYISLAVASVVAETARQTRGGRAWGELAPLLAPTATLEGLTAWLFDSRPMGSVFRAGTLPGPAYLATAAGLTLAAMVLLAWRYRRIPL
jgi:ABC-2 type transport system permease protein